MGDSHLILFAELFLCDTFQFSQILTESSFSPRSRLQNQFCAPHTAHSTRAPQLSRTYARQAAAFTRAGEIQTLETFW